MTTTFIKFAPFLRAPISLQTARMFSMQNAPKLTALSIDARTRIAKLTLNRAPANALNLQMLNEITAAVRELEALGNRLCTGLLITSAPGPIFSAGLDLHELVQPQPQRLHEFWSALQCMWRTLYACPLPTAAYINGHAPAGGCMLAICCDYRVILNNCNIGLNETRVGIAVPTWLIDTFASVLHNKSAAERALTQGLVMPAQEALQLGLVDAVVQDDAQALAACREFLQSFADVERAARAHTKLAMRADVLKNFEKEREFDLKQALDIIQSAEVQQFISNYLQNIKQKKSKK